jgi:hypothetical protein
MDTALLHEFLRYARQKQAEAYDHWKSLTLRDGTDKWDSAHIRVEHWNAIIADLQQDLDNVTRPQPAKRKG